MGGDEEASINQPAEPSWRDLVLVAAFGALSVGLAEVAVLEFRRTVLHRYIWSGIHFVWMTPTAYLIAYLPPTMLLGLLRRRWPGLASPAVVAAGCALLSTLALCRLLSMQRLHLAATAVLALGVGVRVWQLVRSREQDVLRMVRRAVPRLLAVVLLLGTAVPGWRAWNERRARLHLGPASAGAPNIVLIILDTVRRASVSLNGYGRPTTPHLEHWATRGVVFDDAWVTASWTLPSHASMFTGHYPHELSADWLTPLDEVQPTLAETLERQGYLTGGFVGNLYYCSRETGLARGFLHYEEHPINLKQVLLSAELVQMLKGWRGQTVLRRSARKPAEAVTDEFLAWSSGIKDRPFFAFLNYFDAHIPYNAPDSLFSRFKSGHWQLDHYETAIAYLDGELDRLFQELERRGVLDNTIIVVTSDHGEQFGGHRLFDHGNSLYAQLIRVPLLMIAPGRVPAGRRVPQAVTLRNLAATVLSLAGARNDGLIPGTPYTRFWSGPNPAGEEDDRPVLAELTPGSRAVWKAKGELRSLVRENYHYMVYGDGSEELYDFTRDTTEVHNLIAAPESAAPALGLMRARMWMIDSLYPRGRRPSPVVSSP